MCHDLHDAALMLRLHSSRLTTLTAHRQMSACAIAQHLTAWQDPWQPCDPHLGKALHGEHANVLRTIELRRWEHRDLHTKRSVDNH